MWDYMKEWSGHKFCSDRRIKLAILPVPLVFPQGVTVHTHTHTQSVVSKVLLYSEKKQTKKKHVTS